jgi:hypothetical protein
MAFRDQRWFRRATTQEAGATPIASAFFRCSSEDRASAFPFKGDDALLIPAALSPATAARKFDSYKSYKEEYRPREDTPTPWAALEYPIFPKYSS